MDAVIPALGAFAGISLCQGQVMHARTRPARHGFAYPVVFVSVPLSQVPAQAQAIVLDRFGLMRLRTRDLGPRDGSAWLPWVRGLLAREGIAGADGEVILQTFPRVLGYAFNPITLWFCHDRNSALRAVLAEVNNTFGERHNYLVAHPDGREIAAGDVLTARKVFHVSPFCEVKGEYRFQFRRGDGEVETRIDYFEADRAGAPLLATRWTGRAGLATTGSVVKAVLSQPWMTLAVTARIHWHALRLWAKRVPYFSKPNPPLQETTR